MLISNLKGGFFMPRGIKKQINYDEEFERIEARITHHTNSIKELKERKEELENRKRIEELTTLDNFLNSHNLLPQDVMAMCTQQLTQKVAQA